MYIDYFMSFIFLMGEIVVKDINPRDHVLESQQFDLEFLEELFRRTDEIKAGNFEKVLTGYTVAMLFYEPSTRTRFSFEQATRKLGGTVFSTENARDFSSASKGESIEDTVRVIGGNANIIVLRHFEDGATKKAALASPVPVINAGEGTGQHPTQALLDVYTIKERLGRLDNLNVVMIGDLKRGRTVRSLAYLLSKYKNNKIFFVAQEANRMKIDILNHLRENNVDYIEIDDLDSVLPEGDVVYMTRTQKERFFEGESDSLDVSFKIDANNIKLMKENSVLLHPLPRNDEISVDVDNDRRAVYFEQSRNGTFVRAALLAMIAEKNFS